MSSTTLSVDLSDRTTADVTYKIAQTRGERGAAFRLVYNSYMRAGLSGPNPYKMRVTPYHLLPTTEVFIATCRSVVISTVTLVIDGALGLPMESIYGGEIARRRRRRIFGGEVSCLADRRADFRETFPVFIRLCRLMGQYARRHGLDELLVACHPRHAKFYRRYMAFEPIGEEVAYPAVQNNPAVALSFDFARIERDHPDVHERFFGDPIAEERLRPCPISQAECDYFRAAAAASSDGQVDAEDACTGVGAA